MSTSTIDTTNHRLVDGAAAATKQERGAVNRPARQRAAALSKRIVQLAD